MSFNREELDPDDILNDYTEEIDENDPGPTIGNYMGVQSPDPSIRLPGGDAPIDPQLLEDLEALHVREVAVGEEEDVEDEPLPPKLETVPERTVRRDSTKYEGCGLEGPLRSIFYAEFHPEAGPVIRCQTPATGRETVSKEVFDSISVYIIPKPQLANTLLTVNVLDKKICGHPVILKDEKYKRNQFHFNVCFVCYPWSKTVQYEPVLIKLSKFLVDLELEYQFLSNPGYTIDLQHLLDRVFIGINDKRHCKVTLGEKNVLQLKVIPNRPDPPVVRIWDVPIMLIKNAAEHLEEWDLTTQQLLTFFDGARHVKQIADLAGVDCNLVKAAVQNLIYYKVLSLVPIFMFRNVYYVTPKLRMLKNKSMFREKFMNAIRLKADVPVSVPFSEVYKMICGFNRSNTVLDIVHRFKPRENFKVDEVKLVQWLTLNGVLRRVHFYPIYIQDPGSPTDGPAKHFYNYFTGQVCYDEICCKERLAARKLNALIENDPNVQVLRI